ncbi:hypothetical protein QQS21_003207 [Conoideocrella luteorostrata]|uniref:N-acetyltransferase domain-containing protein n=1 Tax=Conoideocrella luteorostrata TaxID=1105319 RepID=A0AAJ0CWR9_9HYPO|nr:hypothetical protein QQS21_003207 [Conoideocrella luteorostrata]
MDQPSSIEWVTVKTTLPLLPPLDTRPEIQTKRLVLRRTLQSDIYGWHALRSQPEVMQWTGQGITDPDIKWSEDRLKMRLAPEGDTKYEYIVCLAETGEMIGTAGCHLFEGELGWPVIGYMLCKEFWGKGYATELVHAFLSAWWALPRTEVELKVDKSTAIEEHDDKVRECIVAVTVEHNAPSQRVLTKANMELVKVWEEVDNRDETQTATLYGYVAKRPLQ